MSTLAERVAIGAKDLVNINFNYYIKRKKKGDDGEEKEEDITSRPFYQCPIFTTHNTFINHIGLKPTGLSEKPVGKLNEFISHLVMLTNYFPICVEIDIKGITEDSDCTAGHYKTKLDDKGIKINELCIKIIEEYYEGAAELVRHPLILHLDIEKRDCLKFDEIKAAYIEDKAKLKELEEKESEEKVFELSTTLYKDCMNKVIFREKIYEKKEEAPGTPGMVKVKRRSSALTPKKTDFYFPLENLEKAKIPYITYKSSTGYYKGKFDFNLETENQPFISCIFENQLKFHSRVFPGIMPLKPQFKNSQEILNKTIELFDASENILYVPTLMAFNYKTPKPYEDKNGTNPIILLAQKFCKLYGTEPAELIKKLDTSPYVTKEKTTDEEVDNTKEEIIPETDIPNIYMDDLIEEAKDRFTRTQIEDIIEEAGNSKQGAQDYEIITLDARSTHGTVSMGGSRKKKRVKKGKKLVIDKSTRKKKKKIRVSRKKKKN